MTSAPSTPWNMGRTTLADLSALVGEHPVMHELVASPDGSCVAAPVENADGTLSVWTSQGAWADSFEKVLSLRYLPDGRLMALVRIDDEWTVAVDGAPWDERFEFAWNPKLSGDGQHIGVQIKRDGEYGVAIDGKAWDKGFLSLRDFALSADGAHAAATVQVSKLGEADIWTFAEGTWGVAVDGQAWEQHFINTYAPVFSPDGSSVAAEVRLDTCVYSLAIDGKTWDARYGCVWEPRYNGQHLLVPVRAGGAWSLAQDGQPLWKNTYMQLWHTTPGPDGKRVAAVVATGYGRWTVAVDDQPWVTEFSDLVLQPLFSPDGARVAAVVRDQERWNVALDGQAWGPGFDMVWQPVFSRDGTHLACHVEQGGTHTLCVDGKLARRSFAQLFDPMFSADGSALALCGVEGTQVVREVVAVADLVR
ncbi:MAG: electron transfer complex subunit TmcD [Pseudomonadota bacterium]